MGKILKYCSSCDEGFAERFTFCPDCGASLQAFEMNPLGNEMPRDAAPVVETAEPEIPAFIAEAAEPVEIVEEPTPTVDEIAFASAPTEEIPAIEELEPETPVETTPVVSHHTEAPAFMMPRGILFESEPKYADEVRHTIPAPLLSKDGDGYAITVIEEKNGKQRNYLLLGAAVFMVSVTLIAWGVSLFQKALDVGAIGDDRSLALLLEEVPMAVEEVEEKKKDDKGGGGGGGGREEKEETSQGDLADQSPKPTRPPNVNTPRSDEPMLQTPTTQGPNTKFDKLYGKWGDPNSKNQGFSNGTGTGGGQGSGQGTGQGSGNGSGAGSGSGSGYGGGNGNGIGDGSGDGTGGGAPPPVARVTQPLKILAKQKAQYTDQARVNNVQGTVTLRVTFLASGGIGSISTIKGLPYGLTEQAIAAARNIRFEPELVNGQPRTTSRPVSFTFNIY